MSEEALCQVDFRCRGEGSDKTVKVSRGTTLLEAARRAGLAVASACDGDGICSHCGLQIVAGSVAKESAQECELKRRNRIAPELRLACSITVEGDLVLSAPYW